VVRAILGLILAAALQAQTQATVAVFAGGVSKDWKFAMRERSVISAFTCDPGDRDVLEPGDTFPCTVGLNQPARKGNFAVSITLGPGLNGPAYVEVETLKSSATFTVTVAEAPIPSAALTPRAHTVYAPARESQAYAAVGQDRAQKE
jgi:hypothetical protein